LLRDYAVGDCAYVRYRDEHQPHQSKLDENFYVRGDGTRAYFFTEEFAAQLMREAGFTIERNQVNEKLVHNAKKQLTMRRLFLQGKYTKPVSASARE